MSREFKIGILYFVFSALLACGGGGSSAPQSSTPPGDSTYSAVLSWEAPISKADGSPFADLAGYNVYYGRSPQFYSVIIDVGNVKTYALNHLPPGTYYFAITAYDISGNETDYSDEVVKTLP